MRSYLKKNTSVNKQCMYYDIKQSGDWLQVLYCYKQLLSYNEHTLTNIGCSDWTAKKKFNYLFITGDRLAALFARLLRVPHILIKSRRTSYMYYDDVEEKTIFDYISTSDRESKKINLHTTRQFCLYLPSRYSESSKSQKYKFDLPSVPIIYDHI